MATRSVSQRRRLSIQSGHRDYSLGRDTAAVNGIARLMRVIDYTRHEFHADPERRKAELPLFLLDIPYLFFEGVIPPLSIINEVLGSGGGDAGMSPGTSWKPFALTEAEYAQLIQELQSLDLEEAKLQARFAPPVLIEDPSLHSCKDFLDWMRAVREKYVSR